jgi:hypothetical protein
VILISDEFLKKFFYLATLHENFTENSLSFSPNQRWFLIPGGRQPFF